MGAQAMQNAMGEMTQNWLMAHPILGWGVAHPFWALGMVVALAFMSGGLLRAIAQLTEQLWIDLLQLPMRAIRWGLNRLLPWRKPQQPSAQSSAPVGFYKPTIKQNQNGSQSATAVFSLMRHSSSSEQTSYANGSDSLNSLLS
jgi:hypothetical protein